MTSQTFVDLSRWQFATTAAFHMTFPALSVGLAIFLTAVLLSPETKGKVLIADLTVA